MVPKPNTPTERFVENVWFRLVSRGAIIFCSILLMALMWVAPQWFEGRLAVNANSTRALADVVGTLASRVEGITVVNQAEDVKITALETAASLKTMQNDKQLDDIQSELRTHSEMFNKILQQEGEILGRLSIRDTPVQPN